MFLMWKLRFRKWLANQLFDWRRRLPFYRLQPRDLDQLLRLGRLNEAVMIFSTGFYDMVPMERQILMNTPGAVEWNPFAATQFIIQCQPLTITAILKYWFDHQDEFKPLPPPPVAVRMVLITNFMLTNPKFNDYMDKTVTVMNFIAHPSMMGFMDHFLNNWSVDTSVIFIEKVTAPVFVGLEKKVSFDVVLPILFTLKMKNLARFQQLLGMLGGKFKKQINDTIGGIEEKIFEKKLKDNRGNIELNIGKIIGTIEQYLNKTLTAPPQQPNATQAQITGGEPKT